MKKVVEFSRYIVFMGTILGVLFAMPFGWSKDTGIVHDAGFYAEVSKIDGPDFYGKETVFKEAYQKLKSRYGNDYLPTTLPKELIPIRDRIYKYIMKDPNRGITGKKKYVSGYRGKNNPSGFGYWPSQLPERITRLSYCFGISPRIMTALIQKESNFVAQAESHTGAVGLMQITTVGGAEVLELLGYPNPYVVYSKEASNVFKEYINCYLGEDRPWENPWEVSETTVTDGGNPIVSPSCSKAIGNCKRGSKKTRYLKGSSAKNFDNWIMGRMQSGSHDYGLVIGAVLLKYHLGHSGMVKGIESFNGDAVKVKYSRDIRSYAENVNLSLIPYSLFGIDFNIFGNNSVRQLKALDIISEAQSVWAEDDDFDTELVEELKSYELPGHSREAEDEHGIYL